MQQFPLSWFPGTENVRSLLPGRNPHRNFLSVIPGLDLIFCLSHSYSPKWNWDFLSPRPTHPTPALLFPSNSTFWKEDIELKESLVTCVERWGEEAFLQSLFTLRPPSLLSPFPPLQEDNILAKSVCVAEGGSQVWSCVWNESLPSSEKQSVLQTLKWLSYLL